MSLFSLFMDSITSNKVSDWIPELELDDETAERIYLKNLAKDTVLNFVARTMSTLIVDLRNKDGTVKSDWDYILNVRPNKNMSAADFWQKFFYRLLDENEVLAIFTADNQLLIAEDFTRKEQAVYDDVFEGVIVKGYTFKRKFLMSDVIYLDYNNEKLSKFTKGLFDDYCELFGRILEVAMRNNQIRGTVSVETTGSMNEKKDANGKTRSDKLQEFINKIYQSFRTKSVAIVPKMKGFEYEEYTNKQGVSNQSLDELNKMINSLIDDIANAIGVPTALVYGEKAELKENIDAYRQFCTAPLVKKIADELNAKLLTAGEYKQGRFVEVRGVLQRDPFEYAVQIDKIISSSFFTPNQALRAFGYPESDDPEMNEHVRTKNYETTKGGEGTDDSKTSD